MNRLLNWLLSSKTTRRSSASSQLGVECLGGSGTPAAGRRLDWSFRPSYEQLEERQMLSASGTISAVTLASGETDTFAIGTDSQLYVNRNMAGGWQRAAIGYSVNLRQISAGYTDANSAGDPICWGIEQRTNHVWWFAFGVARLAGGTSQFTQISAGNNSQCYAIAPDQTVWLEPDCLRVRTWHQLATTGAVLQATQVSAGVDRWGNNVAYVIAQHHQVYELWNNGTFAGCPFLATQISAGVGTNTVILDQGPGYVNTHQSDISLYYVGAADGLVHHWMGAGYDTTASGQVSGVYKRLSAGVDRNGHDEVFVQDYAHYVRKWNDSGVLTYTGGQTDEIAAAGHDFVLGTAPVSHALYIYTGQHWYYTHGTAIDTRTLT